VATLTGVLDRLLAAGATIIVIDHDLDLLAAADHLIDMGPGGGPDGGHIVAAGTPEDVARVPGSVTGPWLAEHLGRRRPARYPAARPERLAVLRERAGQGILAREIGRWLVQKTVTRCLPGTVWVTLVALTPSRADGSLFAGRKALTGKGPRASSMGGKRSGG
jgi:hypothetical protein